MGTRATGSHSIAPALARETAAESGGAWRWVRIRPARARRLGHPGDRAEVLRVLDAVERDERARTRALGSRREQLLEPELGQRPGLELHTRGGEPLRVAVGDLAHADPELPGPRGELDDPRVRRARAHVEPPQLAAPGARAPRGSG